MKKLMETETHTLHFSFKIDDLSSQSGINNKGGILRFFRFRPQHSGQLFQYEVDEAALSCQLTKLKEVINKGQWEIKGVMPLTTSRSQLEASTTWGYGLGFSQITGMVVMLQRIVDVSDDDIRLRALRK